MSMFLNTQLRLGYSTLTYRKLGYTMYLVPVVQEHQLQLNFYRSSEFSYIMDRT
jgi:hypothetical protein